MPRSSRDFSVLKCDSPKPGEISHAMTWLRSDQDWGDAYTQGHEGILRTRLARPVLDRLRLRAGVSRTTTSLSRSRRAAARAIPEELMMPQPERYETLVLGSGEGQIPGLAPGQVGASHRRCRA